MKFSKLIITTLAFVFIGTLIACATVPRAEREATARILARRIGLHGTQLYPRVFIDLGIAANEACPQRDKKATPAGPVLTLIIDAIQKKTDDPFLTQDINDVIEILGIDLNKSLETVNLTPEIQATIIQFVCSFAQGVDRAKQNL